MYTVSILSDNRLCTTSIPSAIASKMKLDARITPP